MYEGYFQPMVDEKSRNLTTISDGVILYWSKRLPFGLNCSPAIFSRHMASLLTPLQRKDWEDIIFFSPTFQSLLIQLKELFTLLTHEVKLNRSKCKFGLKEVTFLGHRISANLISRMSRR